MEMIKNIRDFFRKNINASQVKRDSQEQEKPKDPKIDDYEKRLREAAERSNQRKKERREKRYREDIERLERERAKYNQSAEPAYMNEIQAQRLFNWITSHGHTSEEAYEALAYVMGVSLI